MNGDHVEVNLHAIDMNLLVAFDTLARERSVTKAAARMGVTQSAMSHTLRRLRELTGDALLVRGRGGMVLTPRAEALVVPIRTGLHTLAEGLSGPVAFEPATARRRFRLVSPDLFDILVLPGLLARLQHEAPGIDVAVVPHPASIATALETGDVDLAIAPILLDDEPFARELLPAPDLQQQRLFRDGLRCFVRAGHPLAARRRLSLATYTELPHILISPTGEGPGVVDRYLARQGCQRRIALRVPLFSSALAIVADSDLVLTAPQSVQRSVFADRLVDLPVPVAVPDHAVTMVWHPRFSEDPAHRWLRRTLAEVARADPLSERSTRPRARRTR